MIINLITDDKSNQNIRKELSQNSFKSYNRNNLSKDKVSFKGDPISLILLVARDSRFVTDGWSFIKKAKLKSQLTKVIESPHKYTPNTLEKTLITLTKLNDESFDEGFTGFLMMYAAAKSLQEIRIRAGEKNFLKHLDDNISEYRQTKKDFFVDFFNKGYSIGYPFSCKIDLSALDDFHYKNLKENIAETCLYSKSYFEKHKRQLGILDKIDDVFDSNSSIEREKRHTINSAQEICFIISKFDKNTYKDFLIKNGEAYKEKLKLAFDPSYISYPSLSIFPNEKRESELEFITKLLNGNNKSKSAAKSYEEFIKDIYIKEHGIASWKNKQKEEKYNMVKNLDWHKNPMNDLESYENHYSVLDELDICGAKPSNWEKRYAPKFREIHGYAPSQNNLSKAQAMDLHIRSVLDNKCSSERDKKAAKKILKGMQDLVQGEFNQGKFYDPAKFIDIHPYSVIRYSITQAIKKYGLILTEEEAKPLTEDILAKANYLRELEDRRLVKFNFD